MSFRRKGKALHESQQEWSNWIDSVRDLIAAASLPQSVFESEDAWWYFVDKTYSQAGCLGDEAWFDHDSMSTEERTAFWQLLCCWLKDRWIDVPESQRRNLQVTYDPSRSGPQRNPHP